MAITNTIFLKGLLGVGACLGAAGTAIANRGKIVSYFSKDKGKDKKAESDKKTAGGVAVNGTPTTTETTEGDQTQENKASGGGKTANGKGSNAPAGTAGGAGANTGQAKTTGPGADTTTGTNQAKSNTNERTTGNTEINKKIGDLSLPEGCKFGENEKGYSKTCSIKKDELKKVKFLNKDDKDANISEDFNDLNLEIKVLNKKDTNDTGKYSNNFNDDDLRFIFKGPTTDITIKKSDNTTTITTLKKGTDMEFEIYPSGGDSSKGKLLRSWYPSSLGFKVGLKCESSNTDKKCSPIDNKTINFFNDNSSEIKKISVEDAEKSKKITYEEEKENYNQGFKFTVPADGLKSSDNSETLAAGDYEIKYINEKGWALSKATVAR